MEWWHSSHPISWFRKTYLNGDLEIRPPYQRQPVWGDRQKHRLIETVLLNLPIPEIFVQTTTSPEGETTYAIVDGQQRIRTVLQFVGVDKDQREQASNNFALGLLKDSQWKDIAFDDLSPQEKAKFFDYNFIVRYLNTDSEREVRDMFQRLNESLTALKPQELRNAIYTGPFIQLAKHLAEDNYFAENGIMTPALIRRMGDVEFVSELLIGILHGPQGGAARVIDDYYLHYEDYIDEFPDQTETTRLYEQTMLTIQLVFPNIRATRWHNKSDFYSLFVAVAGLLQTHYLPTEAIPTLREALGQFTTEVAARIADESKKVSTEAATYARAVVRGANDKARRADRHLALLANLEPRFQPLPAEFISA